MQSVVTYVPDTTKFGPTPSPEKVTLFWDWFKTNEPALRNLSHFAMAKWIDAKLTKVDPGLNYELGTRGIMTILLLKQKHISESPRHIWRRHKEAF